MTDLDQFGDGIAIESGSVGADGAERPTVRIETVQDPDMIGWGILVYGQMPVLPPGERSALGQELRQRTEEALTVNSLRDVGVALDSMLFRTEGTEWVIVRDVPLDKVKQQLARHRRRETDPCIGPISGPCDVAKVLWPDDHS